MHVNDWGCLTGLYSQWWGVDTWDGAQQGGGSGRVGSRGAGEIGWEGDDPGGCVMVKRGVA